MNLLLTLYVHLSFVVYDKRIRKSLEFSQRTHTLLKLMSFSDDSSERLWLANAFQSSTESCVIG